MSKKYLPTKWVGGKTIGTADVMNNMEEGILNAHQKIDELDSQINDIVNQVGTETLPTTSQTLKGSIRELFQNVSNGKQLIATAITDKGVETSSDETFQQIADKIRQISGGSSGNKVVGEINNGTINLIGLSVGTYTLKYEDNNGILNDYVILTSSNESNSLEVK